MINRVEFGGGWVSFLVDSPELPPTGGNPLTLIQDPPELLLRWPDGAELKLPAPPWWLPTDHDGRAVRLEWVVEKDESVLRREKIRLVVRRSAYPTYPIDVGIETLVVELGALLKVPVWESHHRGRNWAAIISPDPLAPGGLARSFWQRARGRYYYLVPELKPPVPVEFGADYYSARGNPHRRRWYGVVLAATSDRLYLEPAESAPKAIRRAAELKAIQQGVEVCA